MALLSLEVRAFQDELRDMISGVIQLKEWTIDNNVAIDQKGFEVEVALNYPGTSLRASYGYTLIRTPGMTETQFLTALATETSTPSVIIQN